MDIKREKEEYKALLKSELERITAELKKLGAEKILLFGSYAGGREDLFTDLDIIAILKSDLPFIERIGFIYRKIAPRVAADIMVYTPEEWETVKEKPFFKKAVAEGRVLFEEGKRWLEQAKEDLKWARMLAEQGGYHIACFLAQQVAEKAIKALLYAMGETIVLGHSVNVLAQKAAQYNEKIREKCEKWSILDGYYIPTRYPNGLPDSIPAKVYNREIATEAVDLAEDAVNTVEGIMNNFERES